MSKSQGFEVKSNRNRVIGNGTKKTLFVVFAFVAVFLNCGQVHAAEGSAQVLPERGVAIQLAMKGLLSFASVTLLGEIYAVVKHLVIRAYVLIFFPRFPCKSGPYSGRKRSHLVFPRPREYAAKIFVMVGGHAWYLKNVVVADDRLFASLICESSNVESGKITIIGNARNELLVKIEFKDGKLFEDSFVRSL